MHLQISLVFLASMVSLTSAAPTTSFNATSPSATSSEKTNPFFKATDELLLDLRQQMLTRSIKFDEHFRSLLSSSKTSLHNMFTDTYGNLYERNAQIFTNMFDNLEQYYSKGGVKLTESMEHFFEELYQRIFQVFNPSRSFSDSYLACATKHLSIIKPFEDVPEKLTKNIKNALVAARTFEQALNGGIDFIKGIISLGQPAVCANLINEKLIKNMAPHNPAARSPCLNFCEDVIIRCIGPQHLQTLDSSWRKYVQALGDLGSKLSINYNIDTVVTPLDVQISEAIMNFQENGQNITQFIYLKCGPADFQNNERNSLRAKDSLTNRLGKRAVPTMNNLIKNSVAINGAIHSTPSPSVAPNVINRNNNLRYSSSNNQPVLKTIQHQNLQPSSLSSHHSRHIDKVPFAVDPFAHDNRDPIGKKSPPTLVEEEVKNYMLSTKSFWSNMPNLICTSNHTLGSATRRQPLGNCFSEQFGPLDINSDVGYRVELNKLVNRLESMRKIIIDAFNGNEIDWDSIYKQPSVPTNHRTPITIMPTTTTTTSSPDIEEDTEDPDDDPVDPEESGSGSSENHFEDESKEPEEDPIDPNEPYDTEDPEYSSSTSSPTDSSTDTSQQEPPPEDGLQPPNVIDVPILEETNFITNPGFQKSSQAPNNLVIISGIQLLLLASSLVSCILHNIFVTNHIGYRLR